MKFVAAVSSLLLATPAFSGDLRPTLPGVVTGVERVIDPTRPDPNSLSSLRIPEFQMTPDAQDKTPLGESLSPKLNPPGIEFKKSF